MTAAASRPLFVLLATNIKEASWKSKRFGIAGKETCKHNRSKPESNTSTKILAGSSGSSNPIAMVLQHPPPAEMGTRHHLVPFVSKSNILRPFGS